MRSGPSLFSGFAEKPPDGRAVFAPHPLAFWADDNKPIRWIDFSVYLGVLFFAIRGSTARTARVGNDVPDCATQLGGAVQTSI
jgi:hypothetical protein